MVDFSKNLYKTAASQIYRHYKNCAVILVLNRNAVGLNTLFRKRKNAVPEYRNLCKTLLCFLPENIRYVLQLEIMYNWKCMGYYTEIYK